MTKITLEKFGVSVTISDSDNDSGILEHIGFATLGEVADNALKKICSKIQSYRCNKSEIMRLIGADDEDDEDDEEEGEEEENESEEWADDEEEDEEEEEYEEEEEEEGEEEDDESINKKNLKKAVNSCMKMIKKNNSEGFLEVVRENAGKKIKIMNTTKDQRTWVYKIVTNVNDIDAWSLPKKGQRVLVIMCAKKE
ncbi:MAG: hypothetical protein Ct9H90mP28_2680 [Paracoccaceae bacterium]|nr:MAG: hypothetical protein Ct9H90mP28_2680 [Paracoccaceae bacterium]